ncbi:MAG: DUF4843 domain-containing protein [Pedobacter sp.]|uniref:DUF4843 domain-containing protein n=1 Tax=Pedobacter sp. TaxID=1411316 RepID=UPI00280907D1|nr:DUF4843 domain-containing protein [Pedobacter sp.]MDQ8005174.1 DUF4843 domain-containing protein [Pedobacter sp.]
MKNLKYILAALATVAFFACKQDQYYLYNDIARLQFGPEPSRIYTTSYNLADTLKMYTFYYEDASIKQDTVFFDIYAIGGTKNTDRAFTLRQDQIANATNAISGTHFVPFNDPKVAKHYVIKAGTVHTRVPIIILRDPSLKTTTPKLKFSIVADGSFSLGEPSNIWRKLEFTDRLSQPSSWNAHFTQYYFGKYSVTKHAFLINTTGDKWDSIFIDEMYAGGNLIDYYRTVAKTALINYNAANPTAPLKDEFGDLIVFP